MPLDTQLHFGADDTLCDSQIILGLQAHPGLGRDTEILGKAQGGVGGDGGGGCDLLPVGASCTIDSECCSSTCKGKTGSKTCK